MRSVSGGLVHSKRTAVEDGSIELVDGILSSCRVRIAKKPKPFARPVSRS